ncbi:MAG: nuclear transport factor 2 family protein [Erythrobacter sp.]
MIDPARSINMAVLALCAFGIGTTSVHAENHGADCGVPVTNGEDVEAIRMLELQGTRANVEGTSREDFIDILAPEYRAVRPDGSVLDYAATVASLPSGNLPAWASTFEIVEMEIRVYCDVATVVGFAQATPATNTTDSAPLRFRWLHVWTRKNGDWKYTAQQYTQF